MIQKTLYTTEALSTGQGRDGHVRTADGRLDLDMAVPKEMGGSGNGANPEELFAAGYAACFMGAMKFVAGQKKIALPADLKIDSEVGIGPIPNGFGIQVTLNIHVPGIERAVADEVVQAAHIVCPYSNATRGNVDVTVDATVA